MGHPFISPCTHQLSRACWVDVVRYVHARVAVWDLLRRLAQELALPGITADLVDDVDRRSLRPGVVSEYGIGGLD